MEYQALYRKYRPNTFDGVIGQKHITTILKNQIATGHMTHAYLFSGTRGTGKTSTAKILARAVNCLAPIDGEPCNECEACRIASEANVDVIELDAASNNGVDDMRSLIEKAIFAPVKMKKKVYIIDEAHMLSGAAFNALLKTLEEPPAHVMFILATTEPHKIIPTITSRCQRFDFRRLRSSDIIDCVKSVLEKAGAHIDDEGLATIARKANGGMRDALSLADQCISFCGSDLTAQDVYHVLGSADFDAIYTLTDLLIGCDAAKLLRFLDETLSGRDIAVVMQDLTMHFRNLLLVKICGKCNDIIDCTEEEMKKLLEQADKTTQQRLTRALDILTKTQGSLKYYPQPFVLVETALVKICSPEYENDVSAALDRIDILEKKVKEGVVKVVTEAAPVASAAKNEKPRKSKRVVAEDAKKVYKELCAALKEKGSFGLFLATSLGRAVDVKVVDDIPVVYYTDNIQYNTIKSNSEKIEKALEEIGYEPRVRFELESTDDNGSIEETLMEQLGDVEIND